MSPNRYQLVLLGGFGIAAGLGIYEDFEPWSDLELGEGRIVPLALSAQRLLAYIALQDRPVLRGNAAEVLWPNTHRRRSSARLRSTLWLIRQAVQGLVDGSSGYLRLSPNVTVDVRKQGALIGRLRDRSVECNPGELGARVRTALSLELLPDWPDDWLLLERERWNQLRLYALEALAERLLAAGDFSQAAETALTAVWIDPLRESARRVLIRAYAAEGNWGQALSQYRGYCQLLDRELRVAPTAQMEELIRTLTLR